MSYNLRVEYEEYKVAKGDSLYTIAKRYDTTVAELTDINMLTSAVIYPGQVLLVPKRVATDYYFEEYITTVGDTIETIGSKFNVDTVTLGLYNDFGNLRLDSNQSIKIPRRNVYIVKRDDDVDSILSKTNRTADQLLRANSSNWLKTGTKVYL